MASSAVGRTETWYDTSGPSWVWFGPIRFPFGFHSVLFLFGFGSVSVRFGWVGLGWTHAMVSSVVGRTRSHSEYYTNRFALFGVFSVCFF